MNLIERIRNLLLRKKAEPPEPEKKCLGCGKMFPYNPSWEHIPNYCRECKERFDQVQESLLRGGKPRNIRRRCRACGEPFLLSSLLPHYPHYCMKCRKQYLQTHGKQRNRGQEPSDFR